MTSWTPDQIRAIERQQARRNYERLLLHQPRVPVEGLWEANGNYSAVCSVPLADLTTTEGKPLGEWIDKNREITSRPLIFVPSPPSGATRIAERTVEELVTRSGDGFNVGDMADELGFRLRGKFPRFAFRTEPPRAIVTVSRDLSAEERSALESAFEATQANMTLVVDVATLPPTKRDALALIPSIQMPDGVGRETRWFCEADEEAWEGLRASLFGPTPPSPKKVLPQGLSERRARCVVEATSFQPQNIRTVLPLFQKVAINLPLASNLERNLAGLGITENELLHLAEIGRVEVLLPMSLDRYSPGLISRLVERAPTR